MTRSEDIDKAIASHCRNQKAIIRAIAEGRHPHSRKEDGLPRYLSLPGVAEYQRFVYNRFSDVITIPSFDYVSKVKTGWLIVGDHRAEIESRIQLIIDEFGIGVGMMVLHAQQMNAGHIPLVIRDGKVVFDLAAPTKAVTGTRGEQLLYVPVRKFRNDFDRLADLSIVKPKNLWDQSRIVGHEGDTAPCCFYCSCSEINPYEVVVHLRGARFRLSRDYCFGFTFAPFGNPLYVMHFLAWDSSCHPLNMNRVLMTVSDLVELTRQINMSIHSFFVGVDIKNYPIVDGVSNGWAGNSIYHQHFQFFRPEPDHQPPIVANHNLVARTALLQREDVEIRRLSWPAPVYRITADDSINVGLVGNDLAGIWKFLGGAKEVPLRQETGERIPAHTQNIYVGGNDLGRTVFLLLRDRRRISYKPKRSEYVDEEMSKRAEPKENIGVLEASGTMIVDDENVFTRVAKWEPSEVTNQVNFVAGSVHPGEDRVKAFESSVRRIFPR